MAQARDVNAGVATRRTILRLAAGGGLVAFSPRLAWGEEIVTVGLVVTAGPEARALEQGAALGLDEANALATLFGKRLRLEAATASDARAAVEVGRRMARQSGAIALVGGVGSGVAEALSKTAAAEAVVFMNTADDDDQLRGERCARQAFHLVPSVTMYVDALAQWLVDRRRLVRWSLVADQTPRARQIDAAARRALARRGMAPVTSGGAADVLLLAVDGAASTEAIARARAEGRTEGLAGVGGEVALSLARGEANGVWALGWHRDLERFSARELNSRFRRRFSAPLGETSWAAWAAVKLIGEATVRGNVTGGPALITYLESSPPFDGHKGVALTFRGWDHQLRQPLYIAGSRSPGQDGRSGVTVLGEVPGPNLDALGASASESTCRFGP